MSVEDHRPLRPGDVQISEQGRRRAGAGAETADREAPALQHLRQAVGVPLDIGDAGGDVGSASKSMSSPTISRSCAERQESTWACRSAARTAGAMQRSARTAGTRSDLRRVIDWVWEGKMVGARGFEPPASRSRTVRSTKLSYAPTFLRSFAHRSRRHAREPTARTGRIPPPRPPVKRRAVSPSPVRFAHLPIATPWGSPRGTATSPRSHSEREPTAMKRTEDPPHPPPGRPCGPSTDRAEGCSRREAESAASVSSPTPATNCTANCLTASCPTRCGTGTTTTC